MKSAASARASRGPWQNALLRYSVSPEDYPELVVEHDEHVVVVRDLYPKARHHFLVLPRGRELRMWDALQEYTQDNAQLLQRMADKGDQLASRHPEHRFRLGFHAVPSMWQLHMHVISQDFDSAKLKHKKHWNSFTTEFFVDAGALIAKFEAERAVQFDQAHYKQLLKGAPKCPHCGVQMPLSSLKMHTKSCADL